MKDNDLRSFMRDISDDLVKEAEMLAPGAAASDRNASTARGRDSSPDSRRWKILEIAAVAVVTVALATFAIYFAVDKTRRISEPTVTPILTGPAGLPSDEPIETPPTVPTDEPAETPAAGPTDTPTDEPTEIPTETPTQEIISAEPMFTAPPASKMYEFSSNEELAIALGMSDQIYFELLREDSKAEYGEQYARLLQLFADGTIRPLRFQDGEEALKLNVNNENNYAPIRLLTNGLFNIPWIRGYYTSSDWPKKQLTIDVAYLELLGDAAEGKGVEEVITALDPAYLTPSNFKKDSASAKAAGIASVRKKHIQTRRNNSFEMILYSWEDGTRKYIFLLDGCLVTFTTWIDTDPYFSEYEFFYNLSLSPFTIESYMLSDEPYPRVQRSTDPTRITMEEAKQLIRDAMIIDAALDGHYQWFEGGTRRGQFADQFLNISGTYNNDPAVYRLVRDGFDPDSVKEFINDTFVSRIAGEYTGRDWFFDRYYTAEDGKLYYLFATYEDEELMYVSNSVKIDRYRIDSLVLDEQGAKGTLSAYDYTFSGEIKAYVTFAWDGGQWKIASFDTTDAAFSEYSSGFVMDSFSADNALRVIQTVLVDLYSLTHADAAGLNATSLIPEPGVNAPEYAYRGAKQYKLATGKLSDPSLWIDYASRYLSEPVLRRVLCDGQCVLFSGDGVYWRAGYSYFEDVFSLGYAWFSGTQMSDKIKAEILEQSGTKAIVRLSGLAYTARYRAKYEYYDVDYDDRIGRDLIFEFELTDGVWKISGGDFIDLLDLVFCDPATEPYPTGAAPADVPPAPTYPDLKTNWSSFFSGRSISCITTYKEVHLKPGESMKIPVIWTYKEGINPEGYELFIDFESSEAVNFTVLDGSEAPECAACFVASAISRGKAEVHVYGTYDVDNITNETLRRMLSQEDQELNGVLIDVMLTVYVD